MARERFSRRLDRLRDAVVAMGDLVREQLDGAIAALFTCDRELARDVIDADREVNRRYLALERECLDLIALHQPVAGDLRIVVAAFKIVTDLERVGDLATTLAGYAAESNDCGIPDVDFERLAALARELIGDAIDAFVAEDAEGCLAIAEREAELDRRAAGVNERIVRRLLELSVDAAHSRLAELLEDVSRALLVVRDVERIGDHAVNVAARTLYAVESDDRLLS